VGFLRRGESSRLVSFEALLGWGVGV